MIAREREIERDCRPSGTCTYSLYLENVADTSVWLWFVHVNYALSSMVVDYLEEEQEGARGE